MHMNENCDSVARVIALSGIAGGYTDQDITVEEQIGRLEPGTFYPEGTPINQIIFEMIHGSQQSQTVTIYYGATDNIPTSTSGLTSKSVKLYSLISGYSVHIDSGNTETKTAQYVTFVIPKNYKIQKWCVAEFQYNIPNTKVIVDANAIYYLNAPSYDIDDGGINYLVTISAK